MLSKCANPACPTPFRYLHEGKIFNIEVACARDYSNGRARKLEHYWLCGSCVRSMTVVCEGGTVFAKLARPALGAGASPAPARAA